MPYPPPPGVCTSNTSPGCILPKSSGPNNTRAGRAQKRGLVEQLVHGSWGVKSREVQTHFTDVPVYGSIPAGYAGNPFGSYAQLEACVHCGAAVQPPAQRNMAQRLATRTAHLLTRTQQTLVRPHANWLHMRLRKNMRADG